MGHWAELAVGVGVFLVGFAIGRWTNRRRGFRIYFLLEGIDQSGTSAVPSPRDPGAPSTAASDAPSGD